MKNIFLAGFIACFTLNAFCYNPNSYQPTPGPLQLGDNISFASPNIDPVNRGAIMNALLTDPILAKACAAVAAFDGLPYNGRHTHLRSYQQYMDSIPLSTNPQAATAALQGFEAAIMHLYDY